MSEELLQQADEYVRLQKLRVQMAGTNQAKMITNHMLDMPISWDEVIKALADEVRKNHHEKEFIYKQVERGLFDKHTTPELALSNISYYPQAPWSEDSTWTWDVTHKEYSAEFYKKFPLPQSTKER